MSTKLRLFTCLLLPLFALAFVITSCEDSDDDVDNGFNATNSDFANFTTWEIIDYTVHPVNDAKLGGAHGNNINSGRIIYQNSDAQMNGAEWADGSIFVKETFTWVDGEKTPAAAGAFLGMVKRGGEFNPDHGAWEYFMLDAAGEIQTRGTADLGACQSCHETAAVDYLFPHPSEHIVPAAAEWDVFEDALTWEKVDSQEGPDPFLGQAHGITDDLIRDVYKWQPGALYANGQFPVGTIILKESYQMDDNNEKEYVNDGNGAWTAMVKRGGDFNASNGNWEWFMINPTTQTVARGGDLMNNMCNGCHAEAPNGTPAGADYVFNHPNMGF